MKEGKEGWEREEGGKVGENESQGGRERGRKKGKEKRRELG